MTKRQKNWTYTLAFIALSSASLQFIQIQSATAKPQSKGKSAKSEQGASSCSTSHLDKATVEEFPGSEINRLTATGLGKFSQGDFKGAAEEFGSAISIDPKRGSLYLQRGLARLEQEQYQTALEDFNKAEELDKSQHQLILICRGRAYEGLGKPNDALADLHKAIELDQKDPLAYISRADVFLEKGEDEKALADLERALKLDPEQPKAYLLRARYYKKLKKNDLAIADFNTAIKLDSSLIDQEVGPDSRTSKELKEHFVKGTKLDKKEVAAQMVERGLALERTGEYLRAIREFSEAISDSPDSLEAYRWRANVYMHMSSFASAVADLTKALEISPEDSSLYALRGKAYLEMGSAEKAISDYSKAIAYSKSPAYHLYEARGLVYSRGGRSDKAIADFTKSIELDPANSTSYADRGMENLVLKKYPEAINDFSESIKRGHDLAISHKFRGQCRYYMGDTKSALEDLEKAGAIYKENKDLYGSRQIEKLIALWRKEANKGSSSAIR